MQVDRFLNRPSVIFAVTADDDPDEYGNEIAGTPSETIALCFFEPWSRQTGGEEANVDRATTSDEWRYIVAADTDLTSVDHITVAGESGEFEVIGAPVREWNPLTADSAYLSARLRRTQR